MHNNNPQDMPMLHRAPQQREKLEGGKRFVMCTEFEPAGDQPTAIAELSTGVLQGERDQVLLGATGTGKTFTMMGWWRSPQVPIRHRHCKRLFLARSVVC